MRRIRAGMLALTVLASALSACAAPTAAPTATASATPSAIPDVVSTRLMAELIGQLEQVDGCWRVQARADPTYSVLLVLPADFDAAPSGDALRMSDLLLKQQTTWHVGDILDIGGGNIPGLGPGLRPIGLTTCPGPYWVVGSIDPSATPTPTAPAPTTLAAATPTPASSATPFSVFAMVVDSESGNVRAGPSTVYDVVGQLEPGRQYPVLGQSGPDSTWWQVLLDPGLPGWVNGEIVTLSGDTQNVPVVSPPPTPTIPPPNATEIAYGDLISFTSTALGLSFSYQPSQSGLHVLAQVVGSRVYVYDTSLTLLDGQYVEVLPKNPGDSLKQAIQKQILAGFEPAAWQLASLPLADDSGYPRPAGQTYAVLLPRVPPTVSASDDLVATQVAQAAHCPPVYTVNGGSAYFMADSAHPDRYFFFKIGQYWIYSDGDIPWQDTLQVQAAEN